MKAGALCLIFTPNSHSVLVITKVRGQGRSRFGCTSVGQFSTSHFHRGLAHMGQSLASVPNDLLWFQLGLDLGFTVKLMSSRKKFFLKASPLAPKCSAQE